MATLGTMRPRIADELQIAATTFATEIDRAVFSAISFYEDEDFWFLESTPTNVLFTATSVYSLSTVLPGRSQITNILLQYTPTREPMLYRGLTELLGMAYDDTFTGDPLYYTINADQLIVRPKPSRTFTAEVWYSLRASMTASASSSGVWTNEAEELIRLHAEVDFLENRIKDYDDAMKKRGREGEVLGKLNEKTIKRRGSRRIKPSL